MSVDFEARISKGLSRAIAQDARAFAKVVPNAVVRAGRGARNSLRTTIKKQFKRHRAGGGQAFADTIPKIKQDLIELPSGEKGVHIRTKAEYYKRRSRVFDLFDIFDNAPVVVASGKGKLIAVPLPDAHLPLIGQGTTTQLAWPRHLKALGWKFKIIPAGVGKLKTPLIVGGPSRDPKTWKPLYTMHRQVIIKKKLNLSVVGKRFADRIPKYADAEFDKIGRRLVTQSRAFSAAA